MALETVSEWNTNPLLNVDIGDRKLDDNNDRDAKIRELMSQIAALVNDGTGAPWMDKATYDPTSVAGDAFDMDNMVEGTDNKIMTAAERSEIARYLSFGTVALLVADTGMAYSSGSPTVSSGDVIYAQGFRYTVAASGASDNDLVTAGGVKLYVQPNSSGEYNIDSFNATGDGSADDSAAIKAAFDKSAGAPLRLTAGKSYKARNVHVESDLHLIGYGATFTCFFNDALTGCTENWMYCETADAVSKIKVYGGSVDGSYSAAVTLVDNDSVFKFVGSGDYRVRDITFDDCGTGTAHIGGGAASDGSITSGDATFTSASASFDSNDIGKRIQVAGAGAASAALKTTIASINSATSVELAATASSTVSGAAYTYSDLINDQSFCLVFISGAKYAEISGCVSASGNRKYNEFKIVECDKYLFDNNYSANASTASIDTLVSVFNCGPGMVSRNYCANRTVSAMNILSHDAEICHNTIYYIRNAGGTGGSYGIDTNEGLFYAERCNIHNNNVDQCYRAGIAACGSGTRIAQNKTTNCLYGHYIYNTIDDYVWVYGDWLTQTESPVKGISLDLGYSNDHDSQSAGSNSGLAVIGQSSTNLISLEINNPQFQYKSTATENCLLLTNCDIVRINGGHLSDARSSLIYTSGTVNHLVLNGVELEYDSDGSVNGVTYLADMETMVFNDCKFNGDNGASNYDIVRSSPGAVEEIHLNRCRILDDSSVDRALETSVPSGTRILYNGAIQDDIALTSVNVPANSRQDYAGETLSGVRTGDMITANVLGSGHSIFATAYYTADNTITIRLLNGTGSADTNDKTVRVRATPTGYPG